MCTYDINGNKVNDGLNYIDTYTPIISTTISGIDLYKEDAFSWYEGVAGTTKTAIVNARAVYNAGVYYGDIAPVIYENGEPIIKDNRMYYTKSSARHLGGMGAAVYEYNIGTGELHLTGIIGGYKTINDEEVLYNSVAIHVMYNRNTGEWQYTTGAAPVTSHVLHYGHSYNSPLHGRTIVEFYALEYEGTPNGDEDPVVYYSDELQKWVLVYCKVVNDVYKAVLQTSDYSDRGFSLYKVATNDVNTTGLNVCRVNNIMYVLSGDAASNGVNRFAVLSIPDLNFVCHLNLDYNNGGWRSWNSLVAVPESDYTKYYLLTFDKAACSPSWEFTYGYLYMYCSIEKNKGLEYPLIVNGESISHPIQDGVDIEDLHMNLLWARPYSLVNAEEIIMSTIDVTQNVRRSGSNIYETVGDTLEQTDRGLSLTANGEAMVYGGSHQPGSMYVLSVDGIEDEDKRYIRVCDNSMNLVLQVAINGKGEIFVTSSSASESKVGDIVQGSKELLIYTGGNRLNLYTR